MRFFLLILLLAAGRCSSRESFEPVTYDHVKVLSSFEHDYRSYTQGLEIHDGKIWESTGNYGQSTLRVWDPLTGKNEKFKMVPDVFVEGMTLWKGRMYVLTWKAGRCFLINPDDFSVIREFSYSGEGWGLTHDDSYLIMSNGSNQLLFRDPDSFEIDHKVDVLLNGKPVSLLNELEYIDGLVWANVYGKKIIVVIDPDNGHVVKVIDAAILPRPIDKTGDEDVLNGIAWDPSSKRLFLTGKYWTKLYEVQILPQSNKNHN